MSSRSLGTWISGTMGPFSAQELAKDVSGDGETTGLGRAKLLRSQLGISFSSCLMMMVSMTKKRSQGSQRVCSCVMKGARSNLKMMEMPPFVTKSKLWVGDSKSRKMMRTVRSWKSQERAEDLVSATLTPRDWIAVTNSANDPRNH